jgi:regulator of protease activity HflC (stomatin/prohibitin superfamily)
LSKQEQSCCTILSQSQASGYPRQDLGVPLVKEIERLREGMIVEQVVARGVRDPRVLEAMSRVPREIFVPETLIDLSYSDSALPIAAGQRQFHSLISSR